MSRRPGQHRFHAQQFWGSRPYCEICRQRKPRSGRVCYKCRNKAGLLSRIEHAASRQLTLDFPPVRAETPAKQIHAPPSAATTSRPSPGSVTSRPTLNPTRYSLAPPASDSTWAVWVVVGMLVVGLVILSGSSNETHQSTNYRANSPTHPPKPSIESHRPTTYTSSSSTHRLSSLKNGDVRVRGYYRKDGTYVRPHYRSRQNGNFWDNYSTSPNINRYTGKRGTKRTPPRY